MTKTTQQLAERVLKRLRVIASDETPTSEDANAIKDYYAGTFAETAAAEDLPYWPDSDIPDEAFEALADLVAGRIAPDFGLTKPDLEASGISRLRSLSFKGPTGRIVAGDYF